LYCESGTFQDGSAEVACKGCGSGYFCTEGSSRESECPPGTHCPANSPFPLRSIIAAFIAYT
jgi:hypothetical protein